MSLVNIKRIARYKVRRETIEEAELEEYFKDWWSQKYNLPNNHPLLLQKTLEEVMIEYYTDLFDKDPKELQEFEAEINEKTTEDDEEWFKQQMGDEYHTGDEHSEEYKKKYQEQLAKEDEFNDEYIDILGK